ncbi:MAG: prepilin peptidase, partial [Halobacteriota archaeon]
MLGSTPDLLRLVAIPVLGWAAWRDVKTRRVPNVVWYPLAALGALLVLWELPTADQSFVVRVAISVGFVGTLAYAFWWLGGFGGADAKALMALSILLPTFPTYYLSTTALPLESTVLGVFSLTVLTNTVIVGLAYPLVLGVRNALAGRVDLRMFLGRSISVSSLDTAHGRLFETRDGRTRRGLDLDALRMYLRWRGTTLSTLRQHAGVHRNPESITDTYPPSDGAVTAADGGTTPTATLLDVRPVADDRDADVDDPWGAAAFLDAIEGSAYGTTPELLREGLEVVTDRQKVWISPGIPFLVPMFVGLVV